MDVYIAWAWFLSSLAFAFNFIQRPQIAKKVLEPASPVLRAIQVIALAGTALAAFWHFIEPESEILGTSPLVLFGALFLSFLWLNATYLSFCNK
jgi:hypothetical protein